MENEIKISIIIPALNEEELLEKLLTSIDAQSFKDYEVIVADADSSDGTREVAKKHGAVVVDGGLPAVGRNAGAKVARGMFLFFLDADVVLPADFLKNAYNEMQERYLDLATCEFLPLSDLRIDKALHSMANTAIRVSLMTEPRIPGFVIFISRRLFERVGGFDESVKVAEDSDLVRRAAKFRPARYLKTANLKVSVRRLDKEGRLAYMAKALQIDLHRRFKGEVRDDSIEYEFGNFERDSEDEKLKWLYRLEDKLVQLDRQYSGSKKSAGEKIKEILPGDDFYENAKEQLQDLKDDVQQLFNDKEE